MAFNKKKDLQNALFQILKEAVLEITEKARQELHRIVETEWYLARPESIYYQRTNELIESLTVDINIKNNKIDTSVYFDPEKIHPSYQSDNFSGFYQHASFLGVTEFGGRSISEWLIFWIIGKDGAKGAYGNNPFDGLNAINRIALWLENRELERIVVKTFKKYGLVATRV